jgi:hypothetical protein
MLHQQSSSYDTATPEAGHRSSSPSGKEQQQQSDSHEGPPAAATASIRMSLLIDNETMYGWLICKVDGQLIHSVLYGQFSKELLPPTRG